MKMVLYNSDAGAGGRDAWHPVGRERRVCSKALSMMWKVSVGGLKGGVV